MTQPGIYPGPIPMPVLDGLSIKLILFSEQARFINGFVLKEEFTLEKKHIVLDSIETN